jgi:hypothetical protein
MTASTVRRLIGCVGLALSASAAGAQTQPHHPTRADLNGEWTGRLELEGGTHDLSLVFQLSDTAFAGVMYDAGRRFGDMESGTFSGDTVKFKIADLVFTGVMTGTTMKIDLIVFNGSTRKFVMTKKTTDRGGLEARRE